MKMSEKLQSERLNINIKYDICGAVLNTEWSDDGEYIHYCDVESVINQHDQLVEMNKELAEALLAAVTYINESPCDPDIYPEQLEAWNKYKSITFSKLILKAKELTK